MTKRTSKPNTTPANVSAADDAAINQALEAMGDTDTSDAAVEALLEAADPVTEAPVAAAEDEVDAEILALLGDETAEAEPVTVADPDVTEGVEEVTVEATEEVDVEIEASDEDAILAELEADETDPAATTTKPVTTRKKREPKATTTAAPARTFTDVAAIAPDAFKTNLDGCTAKKVNEKVSNLIQAVERGSKLSNYTKVAVKKLIEDGKVSGKSLVEAYEAAGLKIGTARAQSQQMTALFKVVGLVTPATDNPRELVLADAGLAKELELLAA